MRKYVLTGGPCSGKTSLLKELAKKGFFIVEEAAKYYILAEQAKGVKEPWKKERYEDQIVSLQIKREKEVPDDAEIVFIDRGLPDALAYYKLRNIKPPARLIKAVRGCKYEIIFFLENLPDYDSAVFRPENREEAKKISESIEKTYASLNFKILKLPDVSVAERVKLVLQNL